MCVCDHVSMYCTASLGVGGYCLPLVSIVMFAKLWSMTMCCRSLGVCCVMGLKCYRLLLSAA